ncbi:aspartyl-phosphate phosphatase Spo0E family protein [Paenibacillus sp. 481]|uniref:aspartyl-phosphate phosphatase Spo0E family protein n=1 Tax=Paenibacillus sp. 481 TaxID=2835869 RepID=UPI001E4087FB|nr:aspartyl-phosphate phosphatase Spo0E family protein [Paenibacillus sp. 481]UHA72209.1 aspartyl-phosphate phosphatase Spo0E family protein [Paenibacillus sp. 481]
MPELYKNGDSDLLKKIAAHRKKLVDAVENGLSLTDDYVIKLSQELDDVLLEAQKKHLLKKALKEIASSLEE